MSFIASHKAKVYLSDASGGTYTQVDTTESTVNVPREIIDVTTLGSDWRSKIQGIKDWSVSINNFFQSAGVVDGLLRDHVLNGAELWVRVDVDGTALNRFSGQVIAEGFEIGLNLTDSVAKTLTLQGTGALTATFAS